LRKYIMSGMVLSVLLLSMASAYAASGKLTASAKESAALESMKSMIPSTLQDAEAIILPVRARYLMYTSDGSHIMWGYFGRGFFTGADNQGEHAWGIYGRGMFAGFYGGDFFWGKYSGSSWKAEGLFDEKYSSGRYVTFPAILQAAAEEIKQ
jgi:hypothetical protein